MAKTRTNQPVYLDEYNVTLPANYGDGSYINVKIIDDIVMVEGYISALETIPANSVVCTLPLPQHNMSVRAFTSNGEYVFSVLKVNGQFKSINALDFGVKPSFNFFYKKA